MSNGAGESTVFQQLGEYQLLEELGESAMFRVFKARHVKLQRDVVIKFLREGNADDRQAVMRFRREMEAVGGIEHPNVVWATDAGDQNGTPYIVMEYLPGQTLQQVVAANVRLPIADACELARQAAVGLRCLHDRGMVHRDVKPSNLLLTAEGVVKLLDFGLVRLAEGSGDGEELTAASTALGTPDYIAPEQASDSRSVDCRADIYSLGCTLYEFLTGVPPFAGFGRDSIIKKLLAHSREAVPSVQGTRGDVPPALSKLLERMLAKAPADRPNSIAEVIATLTPLSEGHRLPALLKATEQAPRSPRGHSSTAVSLPPTIDFTPDRTVQISHRSAGRWRPAVAAMAVIAIPLVVYVLWQTWNPPQRAAEGDVAKTDETPSDVAKIGATNAETQAALEHPASKVAKIPAAVATTPPVAVAKTPQSELADLQQAVAELAATSSVEDQKRLRERLVTFSRQNCGTPEQIAAAGLMSRLLWPADTFQQQSIAKEELDSAGRLPGQPPKELVAVFGTGRLKHWQGVRAIAFSPDGKLLATPGYEGVIRVWDSKTGEAVARLQSDTWAYEAVGFTADGSALIGGAASGWFHVWDVATWKMRSPIRGQGGDLASRWDTAWIVFSPDARWLVAAGKSNTVLLYDTQTGQLKQTLRGHASPVKCVGFSGDGRTAASGDETGTAITWDTTTGALRKKFETGHGPIGSIALNPDGNLLAVGNVDRTLSLVRTETDDAPRFVNSAGSVGSLAFSPTGERLLIGADGGGLGGVREIGVESGQILRALTPHSEYCQFLCYSPDGSAIACGHWYGDVSLWDAATGAARFESPGHNAEIWSVAAAPNGSLLASRGKDGNAIAWSLETGAPLRKRRVGFWQKPLAFASDSNRLFYASNVASGMRSVGFWDLAADRALRSLQVPGNRNLAALVLAPDESFVVSVDDKQVISVWEITGRERLILRNQATEVVSLAVSPDCRLIASASRDERVRLWDARSGEELRTLITNGAYATALAFSPDGTILACGTSETKIRLFEVATGSEVAVLERDRSNRFGILGLAYAPSGALLASCSADGNVRIWDAKTYQLRNTIAVGPAGGLVNAVTFLPDGRHLATANQNGTLSLLRLESR